jgi:hypothetical protein
MPEAVTAVSNADLVPGSRRTQSRSASCASVTRSLAALVFRADDDNQLVSGNLRNGKYRVINRALDKPKFGQTLMDSFSHLRRVTDAKADVDTGMGAPKGDEMPGQPIARDRLAGVERECAPLQTSQFG